MYIGAQPVPPSLIKKWQSYFPKMQFDNNYGLTEAIGPCVIHLDIENKYKVDSIGKSGFGWQARIVRENGTDVSIQEVSELIVYGRGVMKGYYKNAEKTAETIRSDWLYTGDIAQMDNEVFLYRRSKKDVIISGGENIYPVEIEEVLHKHPNIQDVAVIGIIYDRLGEVPAAII